MVILYCKLRLLSSLSLEDVAEIVSTRVLGGIRFIGKKHSIRDEVAAVYSETEFLGMRAVVMGEPDDEGYYLTMDTRSLLATLTGEEIKKSLVDISPLVARLLDGVERIKVDGTQAR